MAVWDLLTIEEWRDTLEFSPKNVKNLVSVFGLFGH